MDGRRNMRSKIAFDTTSKQSLSVLQLRYGTVLSPRLNVTAPKPAAVFLLFLFVSMFCPNQVYANAKMTCTKIAWVPLGRSHLFIKPGLNGHVNVHKLAVKRTRLTVRTAIMSARVTVSREFNQTLHRCLNLTYPRL